MMSPQLIFPDACIVLFARAPVPGQVKTRLIPALGADGACALHQRLLGHMLSELQQDPLCALELWVDQNPEHAAFAGFAGKVERQVGADLGERLAHAAQAVLQRYRSLVVIGSDCPALDRHYLQSALQLLARDFDVVLGPADDGGYVLMGLKAAEPRLFSGIAWGGPSVLEQTLQQVQQCKLKLALLPTLADIDRPEDLALLPAAWR